MLIMVTYILGLEDQSLMCTHHFHLDEDHLLDGVSTIFAWRSLLSLADKDQVAVSTDRLTINF